MSKDIPDRWIKYRPIGNRIAGTRFIAFKVPLLENVNKSVKDENLRLAPHSLLESVPNLGLIVDLTNTDRYYNPQTFTKLNVKHEKLMIPGHLTPSSDLSQRFCKYVTSFLEANADNDKLIGVHCTHGVNRTGYMICYFMITKMNMAPNLAIKTFGDARGHEIERENYTASLQHLNTERKRPRQCSDSRSDNWRDRQPHQNNWQQQQPQRNKWRNLNRDRSQDNGWRQQRPQPQSWWQEVGLQKQHYQNFKRCMPRPTSCHREDADKKNPSSNGYRRHKYNIHLGSANSFNHFKNRRYYSYDRPESSTSAYRY